MTTSETLYRAEELFQEKLKEKTGWGRVELLEVFQACIRKALGEHLDSVEKSTDYRYDSVEGDRGKYEFRPKGSGEIKLGGVQSHRTIVSDESGSHEIREISVEDSEKDYDTHKTASDEDGNPF